MSLPSHPESPAYDVCVCACVWVNAIDRETDRHMVRQRQHTREGFTREIEVYRGEKSIERHADRATTDREREREL